MKCKDCNEKMIRVSDIVTSVTVLYNQLDYKTEELHQCPLCKIIKVGIF